MELTHTSTASLGVGDVSHGVHHHSLEMCAAPLGGGKRSLANQSLSLGGIDVSLGEGRVKMDEGKLIVAEGLGLGIVGKQKHHRGNRNASLCAFTILFGVDRAHMAKLKEKYRAQCVVYYCYGQG